MNNSEEDKNAKVPLAGDSTASRSKPSTTDDSQISEKSLDAVLASYRTEMESGLLDLDLSDPKTKTVSKNNEIQNFPRIDAREHNLEDKVVNRDLDDKRSGQSENKGNATTTSDREARTSSPIEDPNELEPEAKDTRTPEVVPFAALTADPARKWTQTESASMEAFFLGLANPQGNTESASKSGAVSAQQVENVKAAPVPEVARTASASSSAPTSPSASASSASPSLAASSSPAASSPLESSSPPSASSTPVLPEPTARTPAQVPPRKPPKAVEFGSQDIHLDDILKNAGFSVEEEEEVVEEAKKPDSWNKPDSASMEAFFLGFAQSSPKAEPASRSGNTPVEPESRPATSKKSDDIAAFGTASPPKTPDPLATSTKASIEAPATRLPEPTQTPEPETATRSESVATSPRRDRVDDAAPISSAALPKTPETPAPETSTKTSPEPAATQSPETSTRSESVAASPRRDPVDDAAPVSSAALPKTPEPPAPETSIKTSPEPAATQSPETSTRSESVAASPRRDPVDDAPISSAALPKTPEPPAPETSIKTSPEPATQAPETSTRSESVAASPRTDRVDDAPISSAALPKTPEPPAPETSIKTSPEPASTQSPETAATRSESVATSSGRDRVVDAAPISSVALPETPDSPVIPEATLKQDEPATSSLMDMFAAKLVLAEEPEAPLFEVVEDAPDAVSEPKTESRTFDPEELASRLLTGDRYNSTKTKPTGEVAKPIPEPNTWSGTPDSNIVNQLANKLVAADKSVTEPADAAASSIFDRKLVPAPEQELVVSSEPTSKVSDATPGTDTLSQKLESNTNVLDLLDALTNAGPVQPQQFSGAISSDLIHTDSLELDLTGLTNDLSVQLQFNMAEMGDTSDWSIFKDTESPPVPVQELPYPAGFAELMPTAINGALGNEALQHDSRPDNPLALTEPPVSTSAPLPELLTQPTSISGDHGPPHDTSQAGVRSVLPHTNQLQDPGTATTPALQPEPVTASDRQPDVDVPLRNLQSVDVPSTPLDQHDDLEAVTRRYLQPVDAPSPSGDPQGAVTLRNLQPVDVPSTPRDPQQDLEAVALRHQQPVDVPSTPRDPQQDLEAVALRHQQPVDVSSPPRDQQGDVTLRNLPVDVSSPPRDSQQDLEAVALRHQQPVDVPSTPRDPQLDVTLRNLQPVDVPSTPRDQQQDLEAVTLRNQQPVDVLSPPSDPQGAVTLRDLQRVDVPLPPRDQQQELEAVNLRNQPPDVPVTPSAPGAATLRDLQPVDVPSPPRDQKQDLEAVNLRNQPPDVPATPSAPETAILRDLQLADVPSPPRDHRQDLADVIVHAGQPTHEPPSLAASQLAQVQVEPTAATTEALELVSTEESSVPTLSVPGPVAERTAEGKTDSTAVPSAPRVQGDPPESGSLSTPVSEPTAQNFAPPASAAPVAMSSPAEKTPQVQTDPEDQSAKPEQKPPAKPLSEAARRFAEKFKDELAAPAPKPPVPEPPAAIRTPTGEMVLPEVSPLHRVEQLKRALEQTKGDPLRQMSLLREAANSLKLEVKPLPQDEGRVDQAIDLLENFVDSGDWAGFMDETRPLNDLLEVQQSTPGVIAPAPPPVISPTPRQEIAASTVSVPPITPPPLPKTSLEVTDPWTVPSKKKLDLNHLERAIDLLEESLYEESELDARIAQALQMRKQGVLPSPKVNWVIPTESLVGQLPSESSGTWSLPQAYMPAPQVPSYDQNATPIEPPLPVNPPLPVEPPRDVYADPVAPPHPSASDHAPLSIDEKPSEDSFIRRQNFTMVTKEEKSEEIQFYNKILQEDRALWNFSGEYEHPDDVALEAELPPVIPTEGIIRAVKSLQEARELSIADEDFVGLQDAAFGQKKVALPPAPVPLQTTVQTGSEESSSSSLPAVRDDMMKSGERMLVRQSQEFLRAKSTEEPANTQEMSQKLRALALPSAEEKKAKGKELSPAELLHKLYTPKRLIAAAGVVAIVAGLASISSGAERHLQSAQTAKNMHQYDKALQECAAAVQMNPDLAAARICMGQTYVLLHRLDDATKAYTRVLERDPHNFEALRGRAEIASNRHEWALALKDLKEMSVSSENRMSAKDWQALGVALAATNEPLDAEAAFAKALQHDSSLAEARIGHARALRKVGKFQECIADCNILLEANRNDREAILEKGRAQVSSSNYKAAAETLKPLADKFEHAPSIHFELGRAYAGLNNESMAIREFDNALKSDPGLATEIANERSRMTKRITEARNMALYQNPGARSPYMHPLMREYEREESSPHHRTAGSSGGGSMLSSTGGYGAPLAPPGNATEMVAQGYNMIQRGQYPAAIRQLTAAVKSSPNDMTARRYLAHAFALAKRPDEAAEQFNAVWGASGWSGEEELMLADSFSRSGKLDRAINSYEQLSAKADGGLKTTAVYGLAQTYFRAGLKIQAARTAKQGLDSARSPQEQARFQQLLNTIQANPS